MQTLSWKGMVYRCLKRITIVGLSVVMFLPSIYEGVKHMQTQLTMER